MKKTAFFLSLCILLLLGCSQTKYETFKVPKLTHFKLQPNGDIVFAGSGINNMKSLDVSFDVSFASHEFLGSSQLVFTGKSIDIQSDSQFTIHADAIEKVQFASTDNAALSKQVQDYVQKASGGKKQPQLVVMDKELNKQLLIHLGSTPADYALWLTLKDTGKKFWEPGKPMETTFKFGFYQFSALREGNFSNYNREVMEWDKL